MNGNETTPWSEVVMAVTFGFGFLVLAATLQRTAVSQRSTSEDLVQIRAKVERWST